MSSGYVKSSKLEYRPAANLVLEAAGRRTRDPSGEAESLAGRLGSTRMGDRVARSAPAELQAQIEKSRKKRSLEHAEEEQEASAKRRRRADGGFLREVDALEGVSYRPRTKETRAAYELLLGILQHALGDQPHEYLAGAAEEVLAVMKNEDVREPARKAAVEGLLGGAAVSDDTFSRISNIAKAITDFSLDGAAAGGAGAGAGAGAADAGALDADVGVAVVYEDDEEEDAGGLADEVHDEDEEDEDEEPGAEEADASNAVRTAEDDDAGGGAGAADAEAEAEAEVAAGLVPVQQLDAFWLQRQLSKHYSDAPTAQKYAEEILELLGTAVRAHAASGTAGTAATGAAYIREAENKLVALLDYDKFDLIRTLLKNMARIYYVTRLKQAQSDGERNRVREEAAADTVNDGAALLRKLDAALSSDTWAAQRAKTAADKVSKEARELARRTEASRGGAGAMDDDGDVVEAKLAGTASVLPSGARSTISSASGSTFLPPILASTVVSSSASGGAGSAASGTGTGTGAAPKDLESARPERTLDLDALMLAAGAHTMSNSKVTLPDKSWRAQKKGYEEVHVPALKPRPLAEGEREIPIAELPDWAQGGFKGMTKLNRVQSRLYETALFSAENMLLCAPTGAGKTNVAMLSILHELGMHRQADGSFDLSAFKIVYVAPMKALVQEVVSNFTARLTETYGVQVRELSGDQNLTKAEIADTQIIVTTPEKWDVITRKSGERTYTQLVRLLILDEVHLLHDDRGPVLEALIARTFRQVETSQDMVRVVGLSATLPNYEDVATFLRVKPDRGLFYFDNSFRPCPLQQQYIGVTEKKPLKRLALMNEICYEKVEEQAGKNQVLIFVHSRKETGRTARAVKDMFVAKDTMSKLIKEDGASKEILTEEAEKSAKDAVLKELLPYGFAIHHAGMTRGDRALVEALFADGHVQVLVSTATLAWGVNLPAHMVIIKGTQIYNPEAGKWCELSPLDVMQMLGRAGRPQYDTFGEGVIITAHSELQYYLSLMNQQLPIESQMMRTLADNLNAEIVLGSISNLKEAAAWLGYTYLYVRMLRNPALYGVQPDTLDTDPLLLQRRVDVMHSAAVLLDKHNLIRYDRKSGVFQSTALGRVASYYYVTHPTIATFNQCLTPYLSDIDLFRLFAMSNEFRNIVVRTEEKEELRKLLERVPVPVRENMDEPLAKTNVLLQAYISQLKLDGLALMADMVYVQQSAGRLLRAIFEICLRRGWAALARKTLALCKMIDHRQWESATPLRQFTLAQGGLSEEVLRKLEKKDIPFERYLDLKAADLGDLVRVPKLGKPIHKLVHSIPKLAVSAHIQPITRSLLKVDLTLTADFAWDPKVHGASESFWVFVEDADGDNLLHSEPFNLKARYAEDEHLVSFYIPLTDPMPPAYFIRVVSDRWLHSETLLPLSFRSLILPEKFPPHTELLDLEPLPVAALKNAAYQALYSAGGGGGPAIKFFNPIQTQCFKALYEGDGNVLVAANSGAGKTICAEFALLRLFAKNPNARAVYVAPLDGIARERYDAWELRFGRGLDKAVVELTGELAADLKLVERAHIIIATASQWDAVSRRWNKRKVVQSVSLYIVDELEMIGAAGNAAGAGSGGGGGAGAGSAGAGATYEVVVSRMRQMSLLLKQQQIRIVALSTSVANARDLGDWIGAGPAGTFAFHPQVRPVPLEIRLQGFDIAHFASRLMAMARPTYSACAQYTTKDKPALVFAPSRKQAQLSAVDLVTFAAADGHRDRFRRGRVSEAAITKVLQQHGVRDATLEHVLKLGVGYYHEGMRASDRDLVARLYSSGALSVVVATASSAWNMPGDTWAAHLVVIMGTEYYEGREHRYCDYPLTDILHMVGRASRPGLDDAGRAVIFTAATRKEYLKKFLYEPLPVESQLIGDAGALADHLNAEVVAETVTSKQEALDYLTWTFLYRRLPQNPNYYNLQGTTDRHLSDYLSELVDSTIGELETSHCLSVTEEGEGGGLQPLQLGTIAAYYYTRYTSLELFASSLTAKTKIKSLLEIVSSATEYSDLPMRHGEDKALRSLAPHMPVTLPPPADGKTSLQYHDPHVKANLLLQAHFSRRPVPGELKGDQARVVVQAVQLVQAAVDVIAAEGWLKPALAAMEFSQMLVQAVWADKDPVLLQVPHFSRDLCARFEALGDGGADADGDAGMAGAASAAAAAALQPVTNVFELMELPDAVRSHLLSSLSAAARSDVARFCNRYPNVNVTRSLHTDVEGGEEAGVSSAGSDVLLNVRLEREGETEGLEEGAGLGAVYAPHYPKPKSEGWWLVVGEPSANRIHAIKRVSLAQASDVKLRFPAPEEAGEHALSLYFMCDSYTGCDQEFDFTLTVQ